MNGARAVDLIAKKRLGDALSRAEIDALLGGYLAGTIPDYQMAAFLMAVCWQGMTDEETADLTLAMVASGRTLDLSDIAPLVADKHSTGGVGDKTTLVVAPIVAALGLPVGKMSGRGLGFSGGTLDKLESFPGLRVELTVDEFRSQLRRFGIVIAGQSSDLAPADGALYALRDVTATVESIPLIASSVMSKKIAAGAGVIALDVKAGSGAFMKTETDARKLAFQMVDIGRRAGRRTVASVTNMNQPLGVAVGNSLEVVEAVHTLKGQGPADLTDLCLHFVAEILAAAGIATHAEAIDRAYRTLTNGAALAKLGDLVEGQGGNRNDVLEPERLPGAPVRRPVPSPTDGFVAALDTESIGLTAVRLGAGRSRKGDPIDHRVGLEILNKVGDRVKRGEPLAVIHAANAESAEQAKTDVITAYTFQATPITPPKLILDQVP